MRKFFFGIIILLLALGSSLLFMSCGEQEEGLNGKSVRSLSISPASATVEIGKTQVFSVTAEYTDGTTGNPQASWSVTGGIGDITVIGLNALFTATASGSGTVVAEAGGKSAAASVTVVLTGEAPVETELATIEVSPATKVLRVGESETFTASGMDISGEAMDITPTWVVSGDAIGVLTASETVATLEVTAEGSAFVNAISGEVVGAAYVTAEGYVVEITVETDTYVDEANPDTSYGSANSLKAGYVGSSNEHFEAYLYFYLDPWIPSGASIESAVLMIYPISAGSASLQLNELASSFTNSTTWNTGRPSIGTFILSHAFTEGGYNSLSNDDFLELVQDWVNGASNNGLAILQEGTNDGTTVFISKEDGSNPPKLQVVYSTP